jgi:hypothetical protein
MSDSIIPVTLYKTSVTGILPIGAPPMGKVKSETWSQTVYPNGAAVTKVVHQSVSVYDDRAVLKQYNLPNKLDIMI